eukprot:6466252-Prymnesium_polylepis.1
MSRLAQAESEAAALRESAFERDALAEAAAAEALRVHGHVGQLEGALAQRTARAEQLEARHEQLSAAVEAERRRAVRPDARLQPHETGRSETPTETGRSDSNRN